MEHSPRARGTTDIHAIARRIAMWSGPRNISTAMMRSFESRPDCIVLDEPFYAAELLRSGRDHPMRDEVLRSGDTDPASIIARLVGPLHDAEKPAATILYQKHMTHHMLAEFDRAWIGAMTNAFLIREPERVLASYTRTWSSVTLSDIGVVQQSEIFDAVADRLGHPPPVIDAADMLADPRGLLAASCDALDIPFLENMLSWRPGPRARDGVWAPAWYASVERSTGFVVQAKPDPLPELPPHLARIAERARPHYERLARYRLQPVRSHPPTAPT